MGSGRLEAHKTERTLLSMYHGHLHVVSARVIYFKPATPSK